MTITADPVRHRIDCGRHDTVETVGGGGAPMLRCRTCSRFVMLGSVHAAGRRPLPRPVRPVAPVEPRVVLEMPRPPRVRPAAAVAVVEPAPAPAPVAVTLASRYRCGGHPDAPVTWKGTGCPECEHEHAARQRDREHAARVRRERDRLR